jgi:hypothetical protein
MTLIGFTNIDIYISGSIVLLLFLLIVILEHKDFILEGDRFIIKYSILKLDLVSVNLENVQQFYFHIWHPLGSVDITYIDNGMKTKRIRFKMKHNKDEFQ